MNSMALSANTFNPPVFFIHFPHFIFLHSNYNTLYLLFISYIYCLFPFK